MILNCLVPSVLNSFLYLATVFIILTERITKEAWMTFIALNNTIAVLQINNKKFI